MTSSNNPQVVVVVAVEVAAVAEAAEIVVAAGAGSNSIGFEPEHSYFEVAWELAVAVAGVVGKVAVDSRTGSTAAEVDGL